MTVTMLPLSFVLGCRTIASSSNNDLVKTLAQRNYDDNDNYNNDEDDLIQFANNVSLALSHLCWHVGSRTNIAAVAAVANANS